MILKYSFLINSNLKKYLKLKYASLLITVTITLTDIRVTVQTSSTTQQLMLIQQNKFYRISNRSGVAEVVCTVTDISILLQCKTECSVWYSP